MLQAPEFGGAKTDVAGTIVEMLEVAESEGLFEGCRVRQELSGLTRLLHTFQTSVSQNLCTSFTC